MANEELGDALQLTVVTPDRRVLEEICDSVSLPASLGYVTILPQHTPLAGILGVGKLSYRQGSQERALALWGGFFEVFSDRITVLADSALLPEEIDSEQSRQELEEARESLSRLTGRELADARLKLRRAEACLQVAGDQQGP